MSSGTLYNYVTAGEPLRTRAILPYYLINTYKLDVKISEPDEHFPSEFTSGRVPAFRYPCGKTLTESIPICLKLADLISDKSAIFGDGSVGQYCEILQWMNVFNIELMDNVATNLCMALGRTSYNASQWDVCAAAADRQLGIINDHLTANTYLVGEKLTLADLYAAPMLLRGVTVLWDPEYRAKFPALMRWFETVKEAPVFQGFFSKIEYAKESKRPSN